MSSQAGISSGRAVSSASAGITPSSLLAGEGPLAQRVPAVVEPALVLVRPLGRHVVRRVGGAGREVGEEGLVGHQRLLLADPVDRPVGHVLGEVVALLGRAVGFHGHRAVVDRRRVLVRLAADEAVEVLEAAAARGPGVERAHRAGLPDRDLVALAELGGRVAVQLQRLGQRRRRVRADRAVAGRRGRDLRDPAHADRVVVAARQQRLPGRRAERRRVEAVVLEPVVGQPLGGRRAARARRRRSTRRSRRRRSGRPGRSARPCGGRSGSIGGNEVSGSFASYVIRPVCGRSGIGSVSRPLRSVTSSPSLQISDAERRNHDEARALPKARRG